MSPNSGDSNGKWHGNCAYVVVYRDSGLQNLGAWLGGLYAKSIFFLGYIFGLVLQEMKQVPLESLHNPHRVPRVGGFI